MPISSADLSGRNPSSPPLILEQFHSLQPISSNPCLPPLPPSSFPSLHAECRVFCSSSSIFFFWIEYFVPVLRGMSVYYVQWIGVVADEALVGSGVVSGFVGSGLLFSAGVFGFTCSFEILVRWRVVYYLKTRLLFLLILSLLLEDAEIGLFDSLRSLFIAECYQREDLKGFFGLPVLYSVRFTYLASCLRIEGESHCN